MDNLLTDIEAFTKRHDISEWQFGEQVLNDRHFIRQLRDGRDLRMSTVVKVRLFMDEYEPKATAA